VDAVYLERDQMPEKGTGECGQDGDVCFHQNINQQASLKYSSFDEAAEEKQVHNSSSTVVLGRGRYLTIHSDNNHFDDGACILSRGSLSQKLYQSGL